MAQQELSDVSYFIKQRERYNEAINLHEKFIDKYPNSKYLKELDKIYEKSLKGLEKVTKTEKEIEEAKKLIEKEKS